MIFVQGELLRERSKYQRYSAKKNQELRELIQEVTMMVLLFIKNVFVVEGVEIFRAHITSQGEEPH